MTIYFLFFSIGVCVRVCVVILKLLLDRSGYLLHVLGKLHHISGGDHNYVLSPYFYLIFSYWFSFFDDTTSSAIQDSSAFLHLKATLEVWYRQGWRTIILPMAWLTNNEDQIKKLMIKLSIFHIMYKKVNVFSGKNKSFTWNNAFCEVFQLEMMNKWTNQFHSTYTSLLRSFLTCI